MLLGGKFDVAFIRVITQTCRFFLNLGFATHSCYIS